MQGPKQLIFEQLAVVGGALAGDARLELLEVLVHGQRGVDVLVADAGPGRAHDATVLTGVGRALRLSAAMTAGFVTVFGVYRLVVAVVAAIEPYLPWVSVLAATAIALRGSRRHHNKTPSDTRIRRTERQRPD
jgi:hypothetical protein